MGSKLTIGREYFNNLIQETYQQTGAISSIESTSERNSFLSSVKSFESNYVYNWQTFIYPLLYGPNTSDHIKYTGMRSGPWAEYDSLDSQHGGLSGWTVTAEPWATKDGLECLWDFTRKQPHSITGALYCLSGRLDEVENFNFEENPYDDSILQSKILCLQEDLLSLYKDTLGCDAVLRCTDEKQLEFSLIRHFYELFNQIFEGGPEIPNVFDCEDEYPEIKLSITTCDILWDSDCPLVELDGSAVTGGARIELTNSNVAYDWVSVLGGTSTTVTWDDANQSITIDGQGSSYDLTSEQDILNVDINLTDGDGGVDTVTLVPGNGVTLTDDSNNNITIDAKTYSNRVDSIANGVEFNLVENGALDRTQTNIIGEGSVTVSRVNDTEYKIIGSKSIIGNIDSDSMLGQGPLSPIRASQYYSIKEECCYEFEQGGTITVPASGSGELVIKQASGAVYQHTSYSGDHSALQGWLAGNAYNNNNTPKQDLEWSFQNASPTSGNEEYISFSFWVKKDYADYVSGDKARQFVLVGTQRDEANLSARGHSFEIYFDYPGNVGPIVGHYPANIDNDPERMNTAQSPQDPTININEHLCLYFGNLGRNMLWKLRDFTKFHNAISNASGDWVHVAFQWNYVHQSDNDDSTTTLSPELKLWINGALVSAAAELPVDLASAGAGNGSGGFDTTSGLAAFGADVFDGVSSPLPGGEARHFKGSLRDLALYEGELTDAEVTAIYGSDNLINVPTVDSFLNNKLREWWNFGEGDPIFDNENYSDGDSIAGGHLINSRLDTRTFGSFTSYQGTPLQFRPNTYSSFSVGVHGAVATTTNLPDGSQKATGGIQFKIAPDYTTLDDGRDLGDISLGLPSSGQAAACMKINVNATSAILDGEEIGLKDTTNVSWTVTFSNSVATNALVGNTLTIGTFGLTVSQIVTQIISAFNGFPSFPFRALDLPYEANGGASQGTGPYVVQIWQKVSGLMGQTPIEKPLGTNIDHYLRLDNEFLNGGEAWTIAIPKNATENYVFTAENYETGHSVDNTKMSTYPVPSLNYGTLYYNGLHDAGLGRKSKTKLLSLLREFIAEKFASKLNALPEFNATSNVDASNYGANETSAVSIEMATVGKAYNNNIVLSSENLAKNVVVSGFKNGADAYVSTAAVLSFTLTESLDTGHAHTCMLLAQNTVPADLDTGTVQFIDTAAVTHTYTFNASAASNTPGSNIIGIQNLATPQAIATAIVACINDAASSFDGTAILAAAGANSDHAIAVRQNVVSEGGNTTPVASGLTGLTFVQNFLGGKDNPDIIEIEDVVIDDINHSYEIIKRRFEFNITGTQGDLGLGGNFIVNVGNYSANLAQFHVGLMTQSEVLTYFNTKLKDSIDAALPDSFETNVNGTAFTLTTKGQGRIYNGGIKLVGVLSGAKTTPDIREIKDEKLKDGDAPCECIPLEALGARSKFTIKLEDIPLAGEKVSLEDVEGRAIKYEAVNDASAYNNGDYIGKWTPAGFTGLAAWYNADAANITTVVSAGEKFVQSWTDTSANSNVISQAAAVSQPQYIETAINGLPAVKFDGVDDWLDCGDDNSLDLNSSGVSIFIVNRTPVIETASGPITLVQKGASYGFGQESDGGDGGRYKAVGGTASPYTTGDGTVKIDSWNVLSYVTNKSATAVSNTHGFFKDGRILADFTGNTHDVGADDSNPFAVGRNLSTSPASEYLSGEIAEILVIGAEVTTEERQKIEGYLCHKYGLEILMQEAHPYKSIAPAAGGGVCSVAYKRGDTTAGTLTDKKNAAMSNFRAAVDSLRGHNQGVSGKIFAFANRSLDSNNDFTWDILTKHRGAESDKAVTFTPAAGQTANKLSGITQGTGNFKGGFKPPGGYPNQIEQYSQDAFFNKWDCTTRDIDLTPGNRYEITLTGYNTLNLSSDPLCVPYAKNLPVASGALGALSLFGSLLGQGNSNRLGMIEFLNHICLSLDQVGIGINIRNKDSCIEDPKNIFLATNFYEQTERVKTVTNPGNTKTIGNIAALLNGQSKAKHLSKFGWRGPFGKWKINLSITIGEATDGDEGKVNIYYKGEGVEIDMFSEMFRGMSTAIENSSELSPGEKSTMTSSLKSEIFNNDVFGPEINRFEIDHYNPFRHRFYRQWNVQDLYAMGVEDLAKRLEGNVIENVPKVNMKVQGQSVVSRMAIGRPYYFNGTVSAYTGTETSVGATGYFWPLYNNQVNSWPTVTTNTYERIEFDEYPGETFYILVNQYAPSTGLNYPNGTFEATEQDFNDFTSQIGGYMTISGMWVRDGTPRLFPLPELGNCELLPYNTMEVVTWGFPSGVFSQYPIDLNKDGQIGPYEEIQFYLAPNDMFVMETHLEEFTVKLFEGEDICPFVGLSPYSSSDFHWSGGPSDFNCNFCPEWEVAGPTMMNLEFFGTPLNVSTQGFSAFVYTNPNITYSDTWYDGTCDTFCPPVILWKGSYGILVDECDPEEQTGVPKDECCFTLQLFDRMQDGWSGVEIILYVEGVQTSTYTLGSGIASQNYTFCVEEGKRFELGFNAGGANKDEIAFVLFEHIGTGSPQPMYEIYDHVQNDPVVDNDKFFGWTSCKDAQWNEDNEALLAQQAGNQNTCGSLNYDLGHLVEAIEILQGSSAAVGGVGYQNIYNNYAHFSLVTTSTAPNGSGDEFTWKYTSGNQLRGVHSVWRNLSNAGIKIISFTLDPALVALGFTANVSDDGILIFNSTSNSYIPPANNSTLGTIKFDYVFPLSSPILKPVFAYVVRKHASNGPTLSYDTDSSTTITATDITAIATNIEDCSPTPQNTRMRATNISVQ